MKRLSVLLLGLIVITACRSVEDKEAAAWEQSYKTEQARAQTEIQQLKEGDRQAKAHFLERYGRYKCSRDDVPQTDESKGPGHRFKSMQLGDHLALKLKLGKPPMLTGILMALYARHLVISFSGMVSWLVRQKASFPPAMKVLL